MDIVIAAIKSDLNSVLDAGRYMLTGLFIVAVFNSYVGILSKNVNWTDVILRLVIGFVLLQNYTWIMDTTRDIVVGLDQRISPDQSAIDQYAQMNDNMQKQYQQNTQQSFVSQVKDFFFGHLHTLIVNLAFIFYAIVSKIMEAIRYSLAGILYKIGPILVPLILFPSTEKVLKGWYTHYVSVLCWPILWHIALSVAVTLSNEVGASGQGIEQFACLNFAVCVVLLFSPLIVSSLVAGVGMGSAAALTGFMATSALMGVGRETLRLTGSAIEGRTYSPQVQTSAASSHPATTPTTMGGKFKDLMIKPTTKRNKT